MISHLTHDKVATSLLYLDPGAAVGHPFCSLPSPCFLLFLRSSMQQDLSETEVLKACGAASMWTAEHVYPVLPWSCIVLEAVPEVKAQIQRSDVS
jgi:hypothetical protein